MSLTKNAKFLLKQRYCRNNETPYQVFDRVSESLSLGDSKFQKNLRSAMRNGYFLPASPTLRNAGMKKTLLHPCHVLPIEDSIHSIMECLNNSARIFHFGGGVGFNISNLRPKGASLSSGGESSGVVSFLELFDKLTEVVKQGGFRRGALMCVLDYDHPEIINFITSKLKGQLTNFNISVLVDNNFMDKVRKDKNIDLKFKGEVYDSMKAKDLFDQIVFCAYMTGDPGLLFYDRINEDNSIPDKVDIRATNPCVTGNTLVQTTEGNIPIKDLVGKEVNVYCMDKDNNLTISKAYNIQKTKKNASLVEVITTRGTLRCTPDHKIYTKEGWIEAQNLKNHQRIIGLNRRCYVSEVKFVKEKEDVYDLTVDKYHNFIGNGIVLHNCGEVPLPDWSCCNLGAINLSKLVTKSGNFNEKKYKQIIKLGIRTLKNINAIGWYPFPEMTKQMKLLDPCGLGFFGFADALIKLGIYYGSSESLEFIKTICKPYVEITEELAKGSFYKRSQQPTGSLSIIADCSPGIEPVFERRVSRHLTIGTITEIKSLYESKYCKTAHEIEPEKHLNIQAEFQEHIDAGISKTINLSHNVSIDTVRHIYMSAWERNCKGITVFRDRSKEGVMRKAKCDDESCYL